jgi:hypothetical protein
MKGAKVSFVSQVYRPPVNPDLVLSEPGSVGYHANLVDLIFEVLFWIFLQDEAHGKLQLPRRDIIRGGIRTSPLPTVVVWDTEVANHHKTTARAQSDIFSTSKKVRVAILLPAQA